ncbi:uncharacterized protein [Musca autumnalis]|uniref:uncharacterized protein n=1 Tax=Musca autumnalis TaxID=221902 RepID=UPI003CF9DDD7
MFNSCSEWESCYFPRNDKTTFYDDIYNDCATENQQQYVATTTASGNVNYVANPSCANNINAPQICGNISPTSESSVNFNQNPQSVWPSNSHVSFNTNSEIMNCNQNMVATIPRHHPYRRSESQQLQQHPSPMMAQQQPQQQIVYQTTPNYICNNGGSCGPVVDYRSPPQPQIMHPQQQQHSSPHAVVYQTPPTFQRQWSQQHQQPQPMIPFNSTGMPHQQQPQQQYGHVNNNYYAPHVPLPRTVRPSLPCQGNQPWTYAYCYGYGPYSNQEPCQYTQVIDIEDFM